MYGQRGGFRPENRFSPVKVGEELDVTIEAVGEKGDGIAKKKGFVIFVPGAKQGQNVKVKITRVLKKMAFSEVVGEGSGESAEESQDEPQQEEPEEQYDTASDSEDFGDESAESDDSEENAEESDESGEEETEKQEE